MPILKERITGSDGEEVAIYIEVETLPSPERYYEDVRGPGGAVLESAKHIFGSSMDLIRTCAEQVMTAVQKVDQAMRPTELELQLSIKLDSEVGAVLAKASGEAQLQVTLRWTK